MAGRRRPSRYSGPAADHWVNTERHVHIHLARLHRLHQAGSVLAAAMAVQHSQFLPPAVAFHDSSNQAWSACKDCLGYALIESALHHLMVQVGIGFFRQGASGPAAGLEGSKQIKQKASDLTRKLVAR